jgi:hypothetical protein
VIYKTKEEIISQLREMFGSDVFDSCMDGYPGLLKRASVHQEEVQRPRVASANWQQPVARQPFAQQPVAQPTVPVMAPVYNAPQPAAPVQQAPQMQQIAQPQVVAQAVQHSAPSAVTAIVNSFPPAAGVQNYAPQAEVGQHPQNPMSRVSREDAMRFLGEE